MTRTQILKCLRSLVVYHQSCGIDYYPATEQLRSGLRLLDEFSDDKSVQETTRVPPQIKPPAEPVVKKTETRVVQRGSVDELAREIEGCRICSLNQSRKIATAGSGGSSPQLMIVGDWLVHDRPLQGNELFGVEQDQMLGNMIRAIGLEPIDVFITNIIKCSVSPSQRPGSDHLTACVSYLKQQIALLRPKVICTMGSAASQNLLNSNESLIGLRGKFHRYVLADNVEIPVMPTFHPTYLLKNPEMKKPTWSDLQAIKKTLSVRESQA